MVVSPDYAAILCHSASRSNPWRSGSVPSIVIALCASQRNATHPCAYEVDYFIFASIAHH
jgi:hypothetical protein